MRALAIGSRNGELTVGTVLDFGVPCPSTTYNNESIIDYISVQMKNVDAHNTGTEARLACESEGT